MREEKRQREKDIEIERMREERERERERERVLDVMGKALNRIRVNCYANM